MEEKGFFEELTKTISKLERNVQSINTLLSKNKIQNIENGAGQGSIKSYIRQNPDEERIFDELDVYIQHSLSISSAVKSFANDYSNLWQVEQKKASDVRKAERKDMWVLWAQKLIRWGAGAIATVLLYSTVVWMSEKCEFIKVPIKDWIPTASQSNEH